jgi:N-acetylglutamate synthase-like GNAT family acetyltransferase
MQIRRILDLSESDLKPLLVASESEGYSHIRRLQNEWISNENRFEGAGEAFFGLFEADRLIGVGGLTAMSETIGRVRRLYVVPDRRRSGAGSMIVQAIISEAKTTFESLVLFTKDAGSFYERLGFEPTGLENPSHQMRLFVAN